MVNEDQMKILKLMNLSEAKANIDNLETQFNKVRHLLYDIMESMASVGELSEDVAEVYKQIEPEIFDVTKFIELLGVDLKSKRSAIERDMFIMVDKTENKRKESETHHI
jgi:hypothetical protein